MQHLVKANKSERTETKNSAFFPLVKGNNSRTVEVMPPKFKLDLCFVLKSIFLQFQNIWFRQTKV